jgi:hypothetical protein
LRHLIDFEETTTMHELVQSVVIFHSLAALTLFGIAALGGLLAAPKRVIRASVVDEPVIAAQEDESRYTDPEDDYAQAA